MQAAFEIVVVTANKLIDLRGRTAEPPRESTYSFPNARFRGRGRRRGRLGSV